MGGELDEEEDAREILPPASIFEGDVDEAALFDSVIISLSPRGRPPANLPAVSKKAVFLCPISLPLSWLVVFCRILLLV
jgi:hypothetical protein